MQEMRAAMLMLWAGACSAWMVPAGPATAPRRAPSLQMGANKKIWTFDGLDGSDPLAGFEAREVDAGKPPVYLLKRIEELKVATAVSEAGLLSAAENAGVFSTLESVGAFSKAEALLPTIEKLGLLSTFEGLLEVEAGVTFTIANFLLAAVPVLFVLQICGFVPLPAGPAVGLEVLLFLSTSAVGIAIFATAYAISLLQGD